MVYKKNDQLSKNQFPLQCSALLGWIWCLTLLFFKISLVIAFKVGSNKRYPIRDGILFRRRRRFRGGRKRPYTLPNEVEMQWKIINIT